MMVEIKNRSGKLQVQFEVEKKSFRNRYLFIFDMLVIVIAYIVSEMLALSLRGSIEVLIHNAGAVICTAAVFALVLFISGMYSTLWTLSGTKDYIRIVRSCVISSIISFIINAFFFEGIYIKIGIVTMILASIGILSLRMATRALHNIYKSKVTMNRDRKRLLIVGAGSSAAILVKDVSNNANINYDIVGFVDDDKAKKNVCINGIKVLGNRYDIPRLCDELNVDEILIATPSATVSQRKKIIEICNETGKTVKILPSIDQIIDKDNLLGAMRKVEIEDLLARDPIVLDNSGIRGYIENKTILVTGGGGSIGSELCRQIMKFDPKKLVILDIYENNAYDLQMELNRKYPDNKPEVVIASVRDMQRLEDIFKKYRPYIVFHAAAHKHVPLMEDSPGEAIKNNVFGTLNVAKCADKYGVKRFVMISTDKAVNPTNVMGATKRICEMIVQSMQKVSKTEFVAVRFGNVLGSNGSVIPLFKRQIAEGGPVTVTDKRITRFFMTIPEAAQLVIQAASYAKGGEIFVLDMGEPVKIYDLAKNLIRLSGFEPDVDIKIEVCGLRPGEKLYEELLMDEEGLTNTSHNKIFIGKPIDIDIDRLKKILSDLERAEKSNDPEAIKDAVAKAVPTYKRPKQVA